MDNSEAMTIGAPTTPILRWSNDALASLLNAFSDEHPVPGVRDAMLEAAKRLRAMVDPPPRYEVTPKGRDALEGRE